MKVQYYVLCFLILTCFNSCDCDKIYQCPTLSEDARSALPFNKGDTVKFVNPLGQHIVFIVTVKEISPSYEAQACKGGKILCSCGYHCVSSGALIFECDTILGKAINYRIYVNQTGSNGQAYESLGFKVSYYIHDFGGNIDIGHNTPLPSGDTLVATLSLGNYTYSNVYIQTHDTLVSSYQNIRIWKAYYTKSDGVIGFYDRLTQTLYYKE